MTARASTSRVASPFEHPGFEHLYSCVLRDVADRRLEPETRKAAARAIVFLLREQVSDEGAISGVLTALHKSLDLSKIVRTLLLGLAGVSPPEKMAEWTRAVADRALREGHLPSFVSTMRILVELRDYDGTVPTRWRLSILRATKLPELVPRVGLFAGAYKRRFPDESWPWIRTAHIQSTVASLRGRVTTADPRKGRDE